MYSVVIRHARFLGRELSQPDDGGWHGGGLVTIRLREAPAWSSSEQFRNVVYLFWVVVVQVPRFVRVVFAARPLPRGW